MPWWENGVNLLIEKAAGLGPAEEVRNKLPSLRIHGCVILFLPLCYQTNKQQWRNQTNKYSVHMPDTSSSSVPCSCCLNNTMMNHSVALGDIFFYCHEHMNCLFNSINTVLLLDRLAIKCFNRTIFQNKLHCPVVFTKLLLFQKIQKTNNMYWLHICWD